MYLSTIFIDIFSVLIGGNERSFKIFRTDTTVQRTFRSQPIAIAGVAIFHEPRDAPLIILVELGFHAIFRTRLTMFADLRSRISTCTIDIANAVPVSIQAFFLVKRCASRKK